MILDPIEFTPEINSLLEILHISPQESPSDEQRLKALITEAMSIAKPKAVLEEKTIIKRSFDTVVIDDIQFKSKILSACLTETKKIYLYLATCGQELASWIQSKKDLLENFYAQSIGQQALKTSIQKIKEIVQNQYPDLYISSIQPGSLEDWPLAEQKNIFDLLGPLPQTIGLQLSSDMLIIPKLSISGIFFPSSKQFFTCQLCPRKDCPERMAPFDEILYKKLVSEEK